MTVDTSDLERRLNRVIGGYDRLARMTEVERERRQARSRRAARGKCPLDGRPCHASADPRACLKVNYPLCK